MEQRVTGDFYEGAWTALVTPLSGGRVDHGALSDLVGRQKNAGVRGVMVCGTTGESGLLELEEQVDVVSTAVSAAKGHMPVVAGAGAASTAKAVKLAVAAERAGADGLLLVCPYYHRPTQAGLIAHFRAIADATSLPIILYNIPGRTGVDLSLDSVQSLLCHENIVGMKDATGHAARAQALVDTFGDRLCVLSGDDPLTPAMMAVGARGVVSVTSNICPAPIVALVDALRRKDATASARIEAALSPMHAALFLESNPGPAKALLAAHGLIAPEIRLPLVWPEASTHQALEQAVASVSAQLGPQAFVWHASVAPKARTARVLAPLEGGPL